MEEKDRKQILTNLGALIENIDISDIIEPLLQRKVFTKPMMDDILEEKTEVSKKDALLRELVTRGPHAFQKFKQILTEAGHYKAVEILLGYPNFKDEELYEVDSSVSGGSQKEGEAVKVERVRPAIKWIEDSTCYLMRSSPRGLCLLINNIYFNDIKQTRVGSELDANRMEEVLSQLSYKVDRYENKKAQEMKIILKEFSEREEHHYLHSCIVVIMSHGEDSYVEGTDCLPLYYSKIFEQFNNENCPALLSKPKMFFFQACRGEKIDHGVPVRSFQPVHRDGSRMEEKVIQHSAGANIGRISLNNDTLAHFCTTDGYVAVRDPVHGSWFIQHLVYVLMDRAWNTDLETMLKEVDTKVQSMISDYGDKQTTEVSLRGFNKKVYFNPGLKYMGS